MIWLTLRQFRTQAAAGFAALAALAAVLAATGPGLADDYASGRSACTAARDCSTFTGQFFDDHQTVFLALIAVVLLLPGLVGLFWGAPLISRELESGTYRLVWNQSVTRTRWLAVKLALVGLATTAVAALGSAAITWWSAPIDRSAADELPRLSPLVFGARYIVPVGYAAFAFVLGVVVGMLVRRTVPAMVLTLAVFAAVQVAVPLLVRPHLLPPTRTTTAITGANLKSLMADTADGSVRLRIKPPETGAWILSQRTIDASGRTVGDVKVSLTSGACAPSGGAPTRDACTAEINRLGYRQAMTYQPPGRFWPLQWCEAGLYALLTLGLTGLCFYRLRRLS
ncbi:ABC transporter permease [Actinomadura opuntiae]|uniref:ABC transporter permease n=1 Tax=Actinomadura sp. OS1-43 TaxID=604315 RepID=UPI00255ACAFA|nr:ABC transporter permease [Actinomadura sp. OS1-43]MDL4815060.1 ABC transporter permease [Actinomadura sp. OS1-43]